MRTQGLGQHMAHIVAKGGSPPNGTFTVIMNILYTVGITCVKLFALFMYERIFGGVHVFKYFVVVVMVISVAWMIAVVILALFTCAPTKHIGVFPSLAGNNCLEHFSVYLGAAITNLIVDIIVLVLPHFKLWKLQAGQYKKIGLAGIFLCGHW